MNSRLSLLFVLLLAFAYVSLAEPIVNERLGIGLAAQGECRLHQFDYPRLHLRWYFDWTMGLFQGPLDGIEYMGLVAGWRPGAPSQQQIQNWVNNNPDRYPDGMMWTVGNEIGFDDQRTPRQYAIDYHDSYHALKAVNPTYRVSNGAVFPIHRLHFDRWGAQRVIDGREYMTLVLEEYRDLYETEMPVDFWMIHGYCFTLDLGVFENLVRSWRVWMAENGQREKGLYMKEFSLPNAGVEANIQYLKDTHRILFTLQDPAIGPVSDNYLLMQGFSWFVNNHGKDQFEGAWKDVSLFDSDTKEINPLGEVFEKMAIWHVGSETPELTNGDIETATAEQAAGWKPWSVDAEENVRVAPMPEAARTGNLGLRITRGETSSSFDGGVSQFIPGLKPDRFYRLSGWVRTSHATSSQRWFRVGWDSSGQQVQGTADSIEYRTVSSGGGNWEFFESGIFRPHHGAVTVWLRAGVFGYGAFDCDLDDLELVETGDVQPNPYCVSGLSSSELEGLGLPSDSLAYDPIGLDPGNAVQIVRSTRFYTSRSLSVPFHAWNPDTLQMVNASEFSAWVSAHPGKTWIVGDRPDSEEGDFLSASLYGRMIATLESLIGSADSTAFLASAGLADEDNSGHASQYWANTRAGYAAATGKTTLPFDIWCFRFTASIDLYAAERLVNEGIPARMAWLRTLDGGAYAGLPIWIGVLEAGGGEEAEIRSFMNAVCPRLERTRVDKWFWNGEQLTNHSNSLATDYASLAQGYVNVVPVPAPEPTPTPWPEGPLVFRNDFNDGNHDGWLHRGGAWSAAGGELRAFGDSTCGHSMVLPHAYGNATYEVDLRIVSSQEESNWAGFAICNHHPDAHYSGGYMIFVRRNGSLEIFCAADRVVLSVPDAVPNTGVFFNLKVVFRSPTLELFIDGDLKATWTDPDGKYPSGLFRLITCRTESVFDNVLIVAGEGMRLEVR